VVKDKSCYAKGILVEGTPKSMRLHIIHRRWRFFALLLLIPALSGILLVFGQNQTQAANPNLINFQGKVVNGSSAANPSTNVTDGSYTFRFCLYTTASPATPCSAGANNDAVWRESKSLTVTNGVFQTELGDTTTMIDVSAYTNLYLGINFNSDAAGEMTPRIHLDSVPYALNSDKLGGLTSSGFIQNTTSPQSTSNFNISGTGVAGTALQAPIVQTGSGDLALQAATGIAVLNKTGVDNILKVFENSGNGTNYASITADHTSATFQSNSGITKVGNGTGAITLSAGSGAAVNITGHTTSVWQTDAGSLTIQGGSTLSLLSTTSSAASLDSGSTGAVSIGTGANDKAVSIGSTQTGTTVSITGGTTANTAVSISTNGAGGITIDSGTSGNVKIGAGANAKAVTVGNTTAGSTLILQGGNTANTAISLTTNTSGGITIDSGTTGNINIGNNANAKAVAIGNSTNGTTVTQTAGATTNTLSNSGNTVQTVTNSATGFAVKNSGSISLFNIDTLTNNTNNLVTNPSFETATMWTAKNGSGASATSQASSPVYDSTKSMQVTTSSTATNAGASFTATLTLNATYVLSLYVKANTTNFSTFQMGYTNTGGDNNCFSSDQTVTLSGWTRMACSFTVTTTTGTAIYVKQTDATGRTYFVDGVLLETDANASGYYENGQISLQGTVSSPLVLQNTSNSANAFLVQNSSGNNIFGVDTTDTNLINNPGVEVNTSGWSYNGTAGSAGSGIFRDTSNSYLGNAGLKLVTDADATEGAKFTFSPNTIMQASTTYVLSFYAKDSAGSYATLTFGRSENGSQTSCVTTGSISTTWQRYSCSFAVGATIGASPYIYVLPGAATSKTIYIDAVSLEPGSTASPYGAGSIYLNGVINSPVNFQNKTDSTTAFQVQNSASLAMLIVDSANKIIQVGSAVADANAVILVVDSYNGSTDPTGTAGGIYYNTNLTADSNANRLRCFENGTWRNCTAGSGLTYTTFSGAWAATSTKAAAGTIILAPIYINGQITVNQIRVDVTTILGAAGDVGLYNAAGALVLNGGSSSLTTAAGLKTITPTQSAANRVIEPGQYYAAVTWNSTTGVVAGLPALFIAGQQHGVGTITGGGLVLPNPITISSITDGTVLPGISINN
jgi:hypothetical protein